MVILIVTIAMLYRFFNYFRYLQRNGKLVTKRGRVPKCLQTSAMDTTKEQLTFSDTGDAVYIVQIKDFHNKLKNWAPIQPK